MNFFPITVILGQLLFVLGASFCQHFWQKSIYKFYQKENKTLSAKNIFFFSSTVRAGRFLSHIYFKTGPTPHGRSGFYSIWTSWHVLLTQPACINSFAAKSYSNM